MNGDLIAIFGSGIVLILLTVSAIMTILSRNGVIERSKSSVEKQLRVVSFVLETMEDVVSVLRETVVVDLKEKSADGQLTSDEIENIILIAKRRVWGVVSDNVREELSGFIHDIDYWIDNKLRSMIIQLKK